ncbi:hypothetical protein [Pseudomonas savastanoi]|uniref:hypothetical protein n=1 Tax=Pseudomonas savastanoi TaxID=29438 RepID=UPI000F005139|nr:hypothetical protein [Pseudomonas savastanoi]RMN04353.1 hypothetical protein ALQ68_00502 [Pseudomonas savastanoi pv. glycinea]
MKKIKIIYALTLLAFSSLSLANEPLEFSREIAVKNRIEEIRVSMINSQVELDKLKSELAALRRAGDAEFFRIKLAKNEIFDKDNFRVLPLIENTEKLKENKIYNRYVPYRKSKGGTQLFTLLIISVSAFFLVGLIINKSKEQDEKVGL